MKLKHKSPAGYAAFFYSARTQQSVIPQPFYADADFSLADAKVGDIGWFDNTMMLETQGNDPTIRVFQVIDQQNMLIKISTVYFVSAPGDPLRGEPREKHSLLWVSGVDTTAMENGAVLYQHADPDLTNKTLIGLFAVTGNKTYSASKGSNSVLVFERIDPKEHEEKFTLRDELRTWTAKSGHTTEAIFAGYRRGAVTLMNLEGKTTDVKLSDLSDDDRKYVREQIRPKK